MAVLRPAVAEEDAAPSPPVQVEADEIGPGDIESGEEAARPLPDAVAEPDPPAPTAEEPVTAAEPRSPAAASCPFDLPGGMTATCHAVDLPASRSEPTPRVVRLFYARVPPKTDAGREPVVILSGGPGIGGTQVLASGPASLLPLHEEHELIFVDQRGTGRSLPSLACPDIDPVALHQGGITPEDVEQCRRLIIDNSYRTAWFDTAESAEDIKALRQELGVRQWSLHGTSYGAALALEVLRRDATGVKSVVLISPTTPGAYELETDALAHIGAVWRQLFVDCAAQPSCRAAYPGLHDRFMALAERLTEKPLAFTLTDPRSGEPREARLDMPALLVTLNSAIGSAGNAVIGPAIINHLHRVTSGAEQQKDDRLAAIYLPSGAATAPATSALGLNFTVTCREARSRHDLKTLAGRATMFAPYAYAARTEQNYGVICPIWDAGKADPALYQPVTSPAPVLLLTGAYDTISGSYRAAELAGSLSNAQLVVLRGVGHGVTQASACAAEAVAAFLAAPLDALDMPCLELSRPPEFRVFDFGTPGP